MPREEYQDSLDDLREDVCAMGELVVGRLDSALEALERGDHGLAREVAGGDDEVDERYLDLEGDCIDLLALQQPVAGDLRFVAASFKILTDLERVGDLAANLARYALTDDDRAREVGVDVADIGRDARDLLADALDAYAAGDAEACWEIAARDDEVDALCQHASERVVRDLIEREGTGDAWTVEQLMDDVSRLLLTIRDLERVADHGVNVAARTLYAVENDPELVY